MSMLLIGGDSYLGRSLSSHVKSLGTTVTSFSSKAIYSDYPYDQFDSKILSSHDFAVMIATPGHNGTENGLSLNFRILQSLSESSLNVYALSTIRTLHKENESEYVRLNRKFEKIALAHSFKVIRIPNFIGCVPTKNDSQKQLLPWSLLENYAKNGKIEINSNLNSEFEWITSDDLFRCILLLQKNSTSSIVEAQPGYKCHLGDLIAYFSDFALTSRNLTIQIQFNNSEIQRKILTGPNPLGDFGWKSELTDKILQGYFLEYLDKNWSRHA